MGSHALRSFFLQNSNFILAKKFTCYKTFHVPHFSLPITFTRTISDRRPMKKFTDGIRSLILADDHDSVEQLFLKALSLKNDNFKFDIKFSTVMATYFYKVNKKNAVLEIIKYADKEKIIDGEFYTAILSHAVLSREPDLEFLKAILDTSSRLALRLDTIGLNSLLEAYEYVGDIKGLITCLKKNVSEGVVLDEFSYGYILKAFKNTNLTKSMVFVAKAIITDPSINLSEGTSFVLFSSLQRNLGIPSDAITELFIKFSKIIPPTPRIINVLIGVYSSRGEFEKAEKLFLELKGKSELDSHTYHQYINLLAITGRLEEIPMVLQEMKEKNIEILEITFHELLSSYGKRGSIKNMLELFEIIKRHDQLKPADYAVVIQALGYKKSFPQAIAFYEKAQQSNMLSTKAIYFMLKCATDLRRTDTVIQIIKDLLELSTFDKKKILQLLEEYEEGRSYQEFVDLVQALRKKPVSFLARENLR